MGKDNDNTEPDIDKYRSYLDDFDLSDAQKTDILKAVWAMMQRFVDREFHDDPVQQAVDESAISRGIGAADGVDSDHPSIHKDQKKDEPAP